MTQNQQLIINFLGNWIEKINQFSIDETKKYSLLVEYLKKNKISLIELNTITNKNKLNRFFSSSVFLNALLEEKEHFNNWRKDFLIIKKEWDNAGIEYIFHKSIGRFPYLSDNLDVLVHSKDFNQAGKILLQLGYVDLRNIQEAHKKFYRKFIGSKIVVPIHLHERVCWSVPYENNQHLWNYRQQSDKDKIVYYPDFEDGILIGTAHCFLEDHIVKLFDLLNIKKCMATKTINWDYIIATADNMHWKQSLFTAFIIFDYLFEKLFGEHLFPEEIIKISYENIKKIKWITNKLNNQIFKQRIIMPFRLPHLWVRRHSSLRVLSDENFGSLKERYIIIFSSLLNGLIHNKFKIASHPPMFIAFSGLDGSGKTKHIEVLQKNFKVSGIRTKKIWGRAGSYPIINFILKIIRRVKFNHSVKNNNIKNNLSDKNNNRRIVFLWSIANVLEMIIFYFIKIKVPLIMGKVIIADRFIYDSMVDLEYLSTTKTFNRFSYQILKKLTPQPDIEIFLDADVNTIFSRGVNETERELKEKHKLYKQLLEIRKFTVIDNTKEFNEVSTRISTMILKEFFKKYPDKFKNYKVISFKYE